MNKYQGCYQGCSTVAPKPPQPKMIQVDHMVRTFTVSVRSMNTIGPDTIKKLIQEKFEVIDCQMTDEKVFGFEIK